ncbi:MAG TPA: STAS domain-containing protein [Rhodanobacteraceae bacterium]|nr:STAS domain-containing protein [Rhodanobacteraceae bacterium]
MAHADASAGKVTFGTPDRDTLALSGALTFASAARAFAEGARALESGTQTRLDLAGLARADSAGLACVLGLAAVASRAGRRLGVVHWPEGLHALAEVCDVENLLDQSAAS